MRHLPPAVAAVIVLIGVVIGIAARERPAPESAFAAGRYEQALRVFAARADTGDPAAWNYIGVAYYLGLGVERDCKRAASLFEQAAIGGHTGAQRNLGILYMRGLGVKQDRVRAYSWFFAAYDGGDPHAIKYLAYVADYITPNQSIGARRWVKEFLRDSRS